MTYFNVFHKLKKTFIIAVIFIKFDLDKQIIIEYNAFDNITGRVFSQFDFTTILWAVAYFSKNALLWNATKKFITKNL